MKRQLDEATRSLEKIPSVKRRSIVVKNALGVAIMLVGIAMLSVAGTVAVRSGTFDFMLIVWAAFALGLFGVGAHIFSSQYTTAAVKFVGISLRDIMRSVRGKNGDNQV